jgi:hypothetical protein
LWLERINGQEPDIINSLWLMNAQRELIKFIF